MKRLFYLINLIKNLGIKLFIKKLINKILMPNQYKRMKKFKEITRYFKGKKGLEIGGPSSFFTKKGVIPVYEIIETLDGVNFSSSTVWSGQIDKDKGYIVNNKQFGNQYILDAVNLSSIKDKTYDFVLSCNNIEHIANPMKAVEEWISVLKEDGVLVIVAPRKESNFDHNRGIVDFDHLISDYENKIDETDLTHLDEILLLHDLKMDLAAGTIDEFGERSLKNFENRCLHHHVFDLNVLKKIYDYFNLSVIESFYINTDYIIIGKKI